jgi:hypothetical protein
MHACVVVRGSSQPLLILLFAPSALQASPLLLEVRPSRDAAQAPFMHTPTNLTHEVLQPLASTGSLGSAVFQNSSFHIVVLLVLALGSVLQLVQPVLKTSRIPAKPLATPVQVPASDTSHTATPGAGIVMPQHSFLQQLLSSLLAFLVPIVWKRLQHEARSAKQPASLQSSKKGKNPGKSLAAAVPTSEAFQAAASGPHVQLATLCLPSPVQQPAFPAAAAGGTDMGEEFSCKSLPSSSMVPASTALATTKPEPKSEPPAMKKPVVPHGPSDADDALPPLAPTTPPATTPPRAPILDPSSSAGLQYARPKQQQQQQDQHYRSVGTVSTSSMGVSQPNYNQRFRRPASASASLHVSSPCPGRDLRTAATPTSLASRAQQLTSLQRGPASNTSGILYKSDNPVRPQLFSIKVSNGLCSVVLDSLSDVHVEGSLCRLVQKQACRKTTLALAGVAWRLAV